MFYPYVFITLLGYLMFSMLCLELSDRRLRRKEAISRFMLHQVLLLLLNFSSPPVKCIHTNGCSILLLVKPKYVILARIKGCVVVSSDNAEKQQHCSEEAMLYDRCSDEATLSDECDLRGCMRSY